jgi:DNA repair exonuclease SbcCD ATPase subunit
MNKNDAVAAKNLELVFLSAEKYYEKHGEIPKQTHIMAQCPGMSKQTAKKYRKEWLAEKGLGHADELDNDDYSADLRKAINNEIRAKKAIAHKKIHDELQNLEESNEALLSENEHVSVQLAECKIEITALREEKASFAAQAELLVAQVEQLQNLLRDSTNQLASMQEQYEQRMELSHKAEREAIERERITREELSALTNSITLAKSENAMAEILDKALKREEWFAEKFGKHVQRSLTNPV